MREFLMPLYDGLKLNFKRKHEAIKYAEQTRAAHPKSGYSSSRQALGFSTMTSRMTASVSFKFRSSVNSEASAEQAKRA